MNLFLRFVIYSARQFALSIEYFLSWSYSRSYLFWTSHVINHSESFKINISRTLFIVLFFDCYYLPMLALLPSSGLPYHIQTHPQFVLRRFTKAAEKCLIVTRAHLFLHWGVIYCQHTALTHTTLTTYAWVVFFVNPFHLELNSTYLNLKAEVLWC